MSNYANQILDIILEVAKTEEGQKSLAQVISQTINALVGPPVNTRPPCQHPFAHLVWLGQNQV